jgi:hypothetical protein
MVLFTGTFEGLRINKQDASNMIFFVIGKKVVIIMLPYAAGSVNRVIISVLVFAWVSRQFELKNM